MLIPDKALKKEHDDHRINILMQELGAIKRQYRISMQGILMIIKVCGILNEHAIKQIFNAFKVLGFRDLVLTGISDVPLIRRATEYLYRSLLDDHIRIFEWNVLVVHGKAIVVDDKWSTVGSFNLNSLNCCGSIEMNVEIYSPEFAKTLRG